mgnify:CR=1 FL=1
MKNKDQNLIYEAYIAEKDKHAYMSGTGGGGGPARDPFPGRQHPDPIRQKAREDKEGMGAQPRLPQDPMRQSLKNMGIDVDANDRRQQQIPAWKIRDLKKQAKYVNGGHAPYLKYLQPKDFQDGSQWLRSPAGQKMLQQMYDLNLLSHSTKRHYFRHLYDGESDTFRK